MEDDINELYKECVAALQGGLLLNGKDFNAIRKALEEAFENDMDVGREVKTSNDFQREKSTSGDASLILSQLQSTHGLKVHQEKDNLTDYKEDPMKILEHVKIKYSLKSPLSTIKGFFKDSKEEELSFKKEEVNKVEERLRICWARQLSPSAFPTRAALMDPQKLTSNNTKTVAHLLMLDLQTEGYNVVPSQFIMEQQDAQLIRKNQYPSSYNA
ncbi:unnamed protein product [Dovyalis caffra]|uniref:Uncharacterized protein n=1 Tax=Dovyalis caffra TaxID=77055 RepID=A0AAV1SJP3_9ROSI|nr:unnamed protein product [Dovyalis caffra]